MSDSPLPPVGTQEERDLDFRLDAAISNSSSIIEEALNQLAMPCSAPNNETDADEEPFSPTNFAISKSSKLLEEARTQLAMRTSEILSPTELKFTENMDNARGQLMSPSFETLDFTELEISETKSAKAWMQTAQSIEQMNDVRADAGQDLYTSLLKDIEEADESSELIDRPKASANDFVRSPTSILEEKRAKRRSLICAGPRVAAVVAAIESIDESGGSSPALRHARNTSVRSFGQ